MQDILTGLTHEEQPFVGPILRAGIATPGTGLTRKVSSDFDSHATSQHRFIGNVAVQLSKGPGRCVSIRFALLLRGRVAMLALRAFADIGQIFQPDETVGMLFDNAMTDDMVAISLQPSLSFADGHEPSGRRTSAFALQPFSQSRIVVGFGAYLFAGIEGGMVLCIRGDCQIALAHIHTDYRRVGLWRGVCYVDLQTDEQVELLLGLVIPEFGGSEMRTLMDECLS